MYGRTPMGQLLYDLGFARLTDAWVARKHRMPIAQVRRMKKRLRKILHGEADALRAKARKQRRRMIEDSRRYE